MNKQETIKKITIIGYYGDNLGDLLMLSVLINSLSKKRAIINILSYGEIKDKIFLEYLKKNKVTIHSIKSIRFVYGISSIRSILKNSKAIVWGGGTCFFDRGGQGGIKYMMLAKLLRNKVYYLGIGIDKTRLFTTILILFIAGVISSQIIFREEVSLKRFNKITYNIFYNKLFTTYDIPYSIDDLELYLHHIYPEYLTNTKTFKNDLVVAYRCIDSYFANSQEYLTDFVYYLNKFMIKNKIKKVILIITDYDIDYDDTFTIYNELKKINKNINIKVEQNSSYVSKIQYIRNSKFIITGRLHVAFLSYLSNNNFILLNYSSKNEIFMKEIDFSSHLLEYNNLNKLLEINYLAIPTFKNYKLTERRVQTQKDINKFIEKILKG